MYPYFEIFGKTVGSYSLFSFLGLFAVTSVAYCLAKRINISFEDILLTVIAVCIGMLIGGHLLYAITRTDIVIECVRTISKKVDAHSLKISHIVSAAQICFGGMVFYGGFIGSVIALLIYLKIANCSEKSTIIAIFSVCVPLFHFFGRIGCFLGGCCYGVESKFGFIANNKLLPEMSGVRRLPIALIESIFNLLLFLFLLYLYNKSFKKGKLIFIYTAIYSTGRFVFEYFRGDTIRGIFFGLSTSQWISIILFTLSAIIILRNEFFKSKTQK